MKSFKLRVGVEGQNLKMPVINENKKKMKHTKNESSSSSEVFGEQKNYHTTSDSSDDNLYTKKRKYKPYEEISREFKKIKPPTFNGEAKKGEEDESIVI